MVAAIIAASPVLAQSKRDIQVSKAEAKKAVKTIQKEGFKLLELGDLQIQLEDFFLEVRSGKRQLVGTGKAYELNLARKEALQFAMEEYASTSGSMVKGRITTNTARIEEKEINDIVAAYERLVLNEIKGEVIPRITLKKEQKKEEIEIRVYCLIDLESAHEARMRAMKNALDELQLSQKYGSEVSNWIDEGLNK